MQHHAETTMTLYQGLNLAALLPCILLIATLLIRRSEPRHYWLPALYFVSLAASFSLPLVPLAGWGTSLTLRGVLLFVESLQPALCFLLILQFVYRHVPAPAYWLILAVPVIGGSSFVLAQLLTEEACLRPDWCLASTTLKTLYNSFATSMIFLLLTVIVSRQRAGGLASDRYRSEKYWLIVALIGCNLLLLSAELASLAGHIEPRAALRAETIVRLLFIYLVWTTIFRVFTNPSESPAQPSTSRQATVAPALVAKIEHAMREERLYREMSMSREKLSQRLDVPEHVLSRAVNQHFGQNFSEFVNSYRVTEAKERLRAEATAITTIAYEVGFNSIASFNRVFKDMTGKAPSEYRSQHAKPQREVSAL